MFAGVVLAAICQVATFAYPYTSEPVMDSAWWVGETETCETAPLLAMTWRVDVETRECLGDINVVRLMEGADPDTGCPIWLYNIYHNPWPGEVMFVSFGPWR